MEGAAWQGPLSGPGSFLLGWSGPSVTSPWLHQKMPGQRPVCSLPHSGALLTK